MIKFDSTIAPETQQGINEELTQFIENSAWTPVKFSKTIDTVEANMIIDIKDFKP